MNKVKFFALSQYLDAAIKKAEYERDEDGFIVAQVPDMDGFYAQGDTFEEARQNLREVIEGNILLALQLGWEIPAIEGVVFEERDVEAVPA
jgi:predicted RNase H-like HicB family nuclease